jgi:hypothetical protein
MNEWTVIVILFCLVITAAGLGTLCDRLDTQRNPRGKKP